MAQHSLGHRAESQKFLDAAIASSAQVGAYQIAEAYAWRGEKDQALEWLERAYRQRDAGLTILKYDPFMRGLRGEARYKALLRELRLPEHQARGATFSLARRRGHV